MELVMPLPKLHVREESGSSRTSGRSPRSPRRTPSPLRNASFRPLAMEYANSPQPSSCQYFNGGDEDEEVTLSKYCALVRTVGYSTVGEKNFMSGKCPHCHRYVKSETQVCTPNATPPSSPWRNALNNLQSPLRSPLRSGRSPSPKNDGGRTKTITSLQSPLRSPFKGSFFGGNDGVDDETDVRVHDESAPKARSRPASPKRQPSAGAVGPSPRGVGLTRSPPRGRSQEGDGAPWSRSRSPAPRSRSPAPRSSSPAPRSSSQAASRSRSPAPRANSPGPRSPVRSPSYLEVQGDRGNGDADDIGSSSGRKPWLSSSSSPTSSARKNAAVASVHRGGSSRSPRTERGRSPSPAPGSVERTPYRGRVGSGGGDGGDAGVRATARSRSRSPAPVVDVSPRTGAGCVSRGPRSPGPRSPLRSPWKGASFFDGEEGEMVEHSAYGGGSGSSSKHHAAKSRGVHSPGPNGPRSPLRVKVDFLEEQERLEEAAHEERRAEAAAAAAATEASKKGKGGWKSPLRSPFKGLFFGGGGGSSSKSRDAGGIATE